MKVGEDAVVVGSWEEHDGWGFSKVDFLPAKFAREFQVLTRMKSDLVRVECAQVTEGLWAVHARVRPVVIVDALVRGHEALLLEPLREQTCHKVCVRVSGELLECQFRVPKCPGRRQSRG